MKTLSWKNILIGLLLGLNIAALASIWMTNKKIGHRPPEGHFERPLHDGRPEHHGPHPHKSIEHVFKSELGFSDDQMKEFKLLKAEHQETSKKIQEEIKVLKEAMFNSIRDGEKSNGEEIAEQIGEKQTALELSMLQHFSELKNLCNNNQKEEFGKLLDAMSKRFSNQPPPPMQAH